MKRLGKQVMAVFRCVICALCRTVVFPPVTSARMLPEATPDYPPVLVHPSSKLLRLTVGLLTLVGGTITALVHYLG